MKPPHPFPITFALLFMQLSVASGGKILVFPLDGSHWVNMKVVVEELHARGHEVTVIRPFDSWYISEKSPFYTAVTIDCSDGFEKNLEGFMSKNLELRLQQKGPWWARMWFRMKLEQISVEMFSDLHKGMAEMLLKMFEDEKLMRSLHEAKYDMVLTDPGTGGGAMLARWLQLPLVYNVRWTVQGEAHFLIAPSPLSYIPFTATLMTDKMNFFQRVKNVMFYTLGQRTMRQITEPHYKPLVHRFFGPDVDYATFFLDADIWLMRNDFVFEFPRPTMPNVVYMGGFQCKPSKPLPADLEEFVQTSGDHGVIIMTLGTLVGKLPTDITEEIAAAFAQLPQKVLWRYMGERPANLGNNTLIVDWLPQNDLLGHPKTRAFVAHGGTNGVQEAIYHGVPVVGLPLFFDQPDNLNRIRAKGGAVIVDIATLDRHVFGDALKAAVYDPSYRENMQRLSRLQRDQPVKPLDLAVFWIEYVMRHKGASHLKSPSIKMSWFVYNSVDVIATLAAVAVLVMFTWISVVRFLWRRIFGKKVKHD